MIKSFSNLTNGVNSDASTTTENKSLNSSTMATPNQELNLSDLMTQINLAQLAMIEKSSASSTINTSGSTTSNSFNANNLNFYNNQNNENSNNFLTNELNNNNPLAINYNINENANNSQLMNESSLLSQNLINNSFQNSNLSIMNSRSSPFNNSNSITNNSRQKPRLVQIKYKFGRLGHTNGQLSSPHGFCLGVDEEVIIADTFNHRICIFDKTGQFKHQFGDQGKEEGQLWYPRKVALIQTPNIVTNITSPRFVVCDRGSERSRMQIFSRTGSFLSRIVICYIDIVAGLAITPEGNIVAVDSVKASLFVILESGELLKWFEFGDQMQEPSDIAVHENLYYICDFKGHCVVVFNYEGEFVRRIGNPKIPNYPNGIDIADNGNILIGDSHGNKFHIVVYDKNGKPIKEFECLNAKVSRCCGLRITKEGYIVTLAKNNHHVLVLDALYYDNNSNSILSCSKASNAVSLYNNSPMSKEDIDLNNYMTQYNLTLLALYDSTNSNSSNPNLSSGFNNKPLANMNNINNITPNNNNNLSSTSIISNAGNSLSSSFAKPSILDNSFSGFNSSLLDVEQQLQDFSFDENTINSFNMSKSILERNDLARTSRDVSSMVNSLSSPIQPDSQVSTPVSKTRKSSMLIKHKFGHLGALKGQFASPHGFCLGADEEIVIADTYNHRICVFNKQGEFLHEFGTSGKEEGQLWHPRKVAVTRTPTGVINIHPKFVVCDRGNEKSRMQLFSKNGNFIRKINIRYIDIVAGLAITPTNNIVAVDSVMPTVYIITEEGDLTKWFDCSKYMCEPSDIAINGDLYYICDFKGHCVVVFNEDGQFLRTIGNKILTKFPNGIDISDYGDVLVGDSHGNRFHVVVFDKNGKIISEFECPYAKVSRCCGLKITSEGYVVTLAKNNHHVLILDTLYVI